MKTITEQELYQGIKGIADKQINGKLINMNRRSFCKDILIASGMVLISGKMVYDSLIKLNEQDSIQAQKDIEHKIYHEYPKYQHFSKTEAFLKDEQISSSKGYGVVIGDKYVTVAHIIDCTIRYSSSPFGLIEIKQDIDKQVSTIYGVELDRLHVDIENDIAVLQIPKNVKIEHSFSIDDVCFNEPKLGEEIYIIGNPELEGVNIRKGFVSDIDSIHLKGNNKNFFGVDKPYIGGDSGTYVVNKKGQVLGINSFVLSGVLGYAVKMKSFEKYL